MSRFTMNDYVNLCTVHRQLLAGGVSETTKGTIYDRAQRRLAQLANRELRLDRDVPVSYDGLTVLLGKVSSAALPPLNFLD